MEVLFNTITPLHIGNGEDLFSIDYIIHRSCLYRISQKQFVDFLNLDLGLVKIYNEWIVSMATSIEDLKSKKRSEPDKGKQRDYNQELSRLQRKFNLLSFIEEHTGKRNAFIDFLDSNPKIYKINFDVEPKHNIRGFMKNPLNDVYIPGTSVKGAVRTALLFKFLKSNNTKNKIAEIIREEIAQIEVLQRDARRLNLEDFKKRFANKLEHFAFYCITKDVNGREKSDDEKFDVMKFLSVSDGKLIAPNLILANIDLFLVTRKRDRHSGRMEMVADKQTQTPCVEAIPERSVIIFDIDFDIDFFLNIKDHIINDSVAQGDNLIWIGIKKKIKEIFNLDIDAVTKENKDSKRQEVIDYILSSVNEFSDVQLQFEKEWINQFSNKDVNNRYNKKIDAGYKKLLNNKGTLLHLGYASGFFGITEFLFLSSDPNLRALFKTVMEIFGIGDKPGADKTRRHGEQYIANPDRFPKSRRLTERNGMIMPLGWLQLASFNGISKGSDDIFIIDNMDPEPSLIIEKKIVPEFKNIRMKNGVILDGVTKENKMVDVYMPDGTIKLVKLVSGIADVGTVIEVAIYPDGKGNFDKASFKKYKK